MTTSRPAATRVLVVDDDADIREMLQSTLAFAGFDVVTAPDGVQALRLLDETAPDALVLDVMMPGIDGFELAHLVREHDRSVPILFLSARAAVEDRVRGLRLGGDDYVTKPFSVVEVAARVEALIRRSRTGADVLRCGDLRVDEARHHVTRGERRIDLSPTEFRLLVFLLRNVGRVVSKGQILDHVWQYDFGGDTNVVERFISNLRRKVDDGEPVALIGTVRGFGYRVEAP